LKDDFDKQKIVFPAIMTGGAYFALEKAKFIVTAPGNIITGENLNQIQEFIQKIGYFALRKYYMGGGIEGELKVNRLELLPIPKTVIGKTIEEQLLLSDEEKEYIRKYLKSLQKE